MTHLSVVCISRMGKNILLADTLIVIGLATVNLGTIQEADGVKQRTFWLRNAGKSTVTIQQGYTSCGCTTIHFTKNKAIASGDTAAVTFASAMTFVSLPTAST